MFQFSVLYKQINYIMFMLRTAVKIYGNYLYVL